MPNRHKFSRASKRVRSYNATLALRAIVFGLAVAPLVVLALYGVGSPGATPLPIREGAALAPQFAMNAGPEDLYKVFSDVRASTESRYIERDKVVEMLARMRREYKEGTLQSKAQLDQALIDYLSTLGDRYAAVLSSQQYTDLMVGLSGQEVGVELNFTMDGTTQNWVVQQMASNGPAAQAGVQIGDVLVSIENYHVDELKRIGNVGQLVSMLFSQAGVIGSKAKLTLRRGSDIYDVEIERTVIKTHPSLTVRNPSSQDPEMMMHGAPAADINGKQITINFMEAESFAREFEAVINKMNEDGVKGIILDLSNTSGGNGESAIRTAALFIDSGTIAHCVKNVGDDGIEMWTYSAADGKVFATVSGPYRKGQTGSGLSPQNVKQRVESLPWKSGAYKGEVVVGISGQTQGAAELLAGSLNKTRKAPVVGTDVSFGKGMSLTYIPVSPDHVVRFATSVYLLPDGASIEKRGIMPNFGVENEFEYSAALTQVLAARLSVIPYPVGPVERERK